MRDGAKIKMVVEYMRAHWPSKVRQEWQVGLDEYPELVDKVVAEWSDGVTRERELVRVAGLSGSGKTTQLLPAVEEYFVARQKRPVLVAARKFVKYHPHYDEVLAEYGEARLREMTDEFATIMMFLVLGELIALGCDMILDVTLLDPKMEGMLVAMLSDAKYDFWMTMVAVAPEVTEKFLGKRTWRHSRATELEFVRATELALKFYAATAPEMRVCVWNVWEAEPVYDGEVKSAMEVYKKYMQVAEIPAHEEEELRRAKIEYFRG